LDRLFWTAGDVLHHKPGAAITSARRAGTTATLDVLNKYIQYCEMPLVTSNYWPMVHGFRPKDVMRDEEGLQIMHVLGKNMAWLLQCIEAGRKAGVKEPEAAKKAFTNFIR
jgi:multimeric flavodoxin WrbA